MIFSSSIFLFLFLPVVLAGYYLCHDKVKNSCLLLASLFFYSWGEPHYIILMLGSVVINFFLGVWIARAADQKRKKLVFLICACVLDLGILMIFKYLDFGIRNLNNLFHTELPLRNIALPIGISFYTFQVLSYVIDVYRGTVKAQKDIVKLGLYISLFPQLIAGPIVRYADVETQLDVRSYGWDCLYLGSKRFMTGFSKKVLIADSLAAVADYAFNTPTASMSLAWIGIIAYSLQIYYDFSGYSDMAIGLGKMFGFDFMENFNYPYISLSIQEFWRRWHISLGAWFRDYVYIPLGGSRKKPYRTYLNLAIVFLLTGFWHGASWNFVFWGLYYAFFLILERLFLKKLLLKLPAFIQHGYTITVILFGWVFFRAEGFKAAFRYIGTMFSFHAGLDEILRNISIEHWTFLILGIFFCMPLQRNIKKLINNKSIEDILIFLLFVAAVLYMVSRGFSPFLYFRF